MLQGESGHNLLFALFKQLPKMFISHFGSVRRPQSCLRIWDPGSYLSVRGLGSFFRVPSYGVLSWGLRSGVLSEGLESFFSGMLFYRYLLKKSTLKILDIANENDQNIAIVFLAKNEIKCFSVYFSKLLSRLFSKHISNTLRSKIAYVKLSTLEFGYLGWYICEGLCIVTI